MANGTATTVDGLTHDAFQVKAHYNARCTAAAAAIETEMPIVAAFLKKRSAEGGLSQHYNPLRLLELRDWLLRHVPKTIVELGTGATTLVFAEYAKDHGATIVSLEENIQHARKLQDEGWLPDEWGNCVTVYEAHRAEESYGGQLSCRYNFDYLKLPAGIDLLYVDGPNNSTPSGKPLVCLDAIKIAGCRDVRALLFDIRVSSVRAFQKSAIGLEYVADYGASMCPTPWYAGSGRHHTQFTKC